MVQTDEGNIGRTDLMFGAEITRRLGDAWHVGALFKIPAYTDVQGGQLDASPFVGLTIGAQHHLFGDDDHDHDHHGHDHHHDHDAPPADWSGLDVASASDDGRAPALTPVPGKITVFDFWATWCEPCGVLDRALAEVARRHPAALAVRKVNIVDVDSPASQRYLGAATIPHVKVFGRDGTLLWERSAPPLVLAAAIEQLVAPRAAPAAVAANARRIAIEVTDDGFVPARVRIAPGEPVILVFTRRSTQTCATDVHAALPDGGRIDATLPLGTPVEIPVRVARPTEVTYACGMDMVRGTIEVR